MTHIPKQKTAHSLPLCLALAVLFLLNACASPTQPRTVTAATTPPTDAAERLLANGDYPGAAKIFLQKAAQASSPQRETLQLRAAEALLRGKRAEEAARILEKLPPAGSTDYQTRQTLAQARVLLSRQQPQAALQKLAAVGDTVPAARMVDFHRARIDAYNAAGNHLESARERVWLEGLLETSALPANHQAIWDSLSRLSDSMLASMRATPPPDVFSGWLELVETTRALRATPPQLDIALSIWREQYPGHPAIPDFLNALQGRTQDIKSQAEQQIAVLLPLTGDLAEAGQALRDGMLTAHFQDAAADSQGLRFYDTGPGTDRVWSLYQRAVSEGAQQVIGPLSKEAVAALIDGGELTVPVLALNNLPDDRQAPALLYQFALAPEDEAEQVAARAWQDGYRRALLLSPASAWGQRVQLAFTQHWQSLGGSVLDARTYSADQNSYSDLVRDLLKLDASEQRLQDLTRLLGQKPDFIPHPRQDADFVVLLGNATQARLLRPLFTYHHAEQLPLYSTSQVYSGINASQDRDLNGLRFCDMPWMLPSGHPSAALRGEISRLWPASAERYARLYALAVDALQIVPSLQGLQSGSFARHPGVTGDLYLDQERRVHRELQWAEFQNGQPVALADLAATPIKPQGITDDAPANTSPAWSTR